MHTQDVRVVEEPRHVEKLGKNVRRKIPLLAAPRIAQLEVEQAREGDRYLELAVEPAADCLPSIIRIKVDAGVPDIPYIDITGLDREAFYQIECEISKTICLRCRADDGIVLIRNRGRLDLKPNVGKVFGLEKP